MVDTLSIRELAERERVAVKTVRGWLIRGTAPESYKIGGRRMFDRDKVIEWELRRKAETRR
jgi:hypothetical protein